MKSILFKSLGFVVWPVAAICMVCLEIWDEKKAIEIWNNAAKRHLEMQGYTVTKN